MILIPSMQNIYHEIIIFQIIVGVNGPKLSNLFKQLYCLYLDTEETILPQFGKHLIHVFNCIKISFSGQLMSK